MAHHIFVLLGKSASGKDTLYRLLLGRKELGLQPVIPYTTRPRRSGEAEGREYHFVTPEQFEEKKAAGQLIEFRCYQTCYGPWYYFTANDGQLQPAERDSLLIGTLQSFRSLQSVFGTEAVVPIYLEVPREERLRRAMKREMQQDKPGTEEVRRRFAADEKDFSEERLQAAGIRRRFDNTDLARCTQEVADYIRSLEEASAGQR